MGISSGLGRDALLPGLVLLRTETVGTGVSSHTVSGVFNATYDAYRIVITGGSSSASENVTLKLGASTTGYYDIVMYADTSATTTPKSTGTSNGSVFARGGTVSANGFQFNIDINNPFLAKYTSFGGPYNFEGVTSSLGSTSGVHRVASSFTDFTIAPGSGTITGGTIRVYGYRN
jgi:hypothetical protein